MREISTKGFTYNLFKAKPFSTFTNSTTSFEVLYKSFFKKGLVALAVIAFFIGGLTKSSAQCTVLDYTMAASNTTFTPITGGTVLSTISVDEALSPATDIGFSFNYLNKTYAKFFVSSNGYVSFQSVLGASTSLTTVNKPVIAPLIGDLSGVGGTVRRSNSWVVNKFDFTRGLIQLYLHTNGCSCIIK